MKYKTEGLKEQIKDLKVTKHFFNIVGTTALAGSMIVLIKENNISLDSSIEETIANIVPALGILTGGTLLGLAPTFTKEAKILEEKINHQEELERIESTKNKVRKRKRHFV